MKSTNYEALHHSVVSNALSTAPSLVDKTRVQPKIQRKCSYCRSVSFDLRHSAVFYSSQCSQWLFHFSHVLRNNSFTHQWLYSPLLGPSMFLNFVICCTQLIGLLGQVISPSQGRYLHTGQYKHRINAHINIHVLSTIRTQDSSVQASEDSSCLTPRGHCDRPPKNNVH
jgi:hypothetical protein